MTRFLGIDFAPIHLPFKRRLQTLAVLIVCNEFFFLGLLSSIFLLFLLFSPLFLVPIGYLTWMVYDKETCKRGSRLQRWYRRLSIWRHMAEYFPITLHKTADLDPNENYIIGYHPHGIMSVGALASFATEATGFSEKFPGITTRLVTLNINFWMPIQRQNAMFLGVCSADKESIEWIVSENGKGNAAVIVIGGAQESLDAIPHKMELTLKNRKGFVKLALKHGASLVPVISFGENELFAQTEHADNSFVKRLQRKLTRILRFAPPMFHGRGVFQYNIGYLPYRKPVNTFVGKPIKVPQSANPSQEDINKYHDLYVESLCDLFNEHREKYSEDPNVEIVIK